MNLKIVGMIPVYNEVDIISEVIDNLLSQQIELVVLDNGSTDGSYEICKKYAEKGLIELEQFKSPKFDWHMILRMLYDMALKKNPDWVLRADQDELLESGIKNLNLREAITKEDENGFNLIQFDVFEFFMTDKDNNSMQSVRKRHPYYSWQHDDAYRAWKYFPGIRSEDAGGHYPVFPQNIRYRISPRKFVLRHYRFRNINQALSNNSARIQRLRETTMEKLGQCIHWKLIDENGGPKIINHELLDKHNEDNQWNHEGTFHPYILKRRKKNEIFDQNGKLIHLHQTTIQLSEKVKEQQEMIVNLKKELEFKEKANLIIRNP